MLYLLSILLVLVNFLWLMLVFFALPGNWLMVISTCLFAWWRAEDHVFSIYILIVITTLAVIGELVEFFGGMGGARKAGAGWVGSIGAILGAISGAVLGTLLVPIPLMGTLLGTCIGAGTGAWALELSAGRQMPQSIRTGLGAGLGQLLGTTTKFVIGLIIWLTVAIAVFWP